MNPFFHITGTPHEVDEQAAKKAKPGQPGPFWQRYHDLEEQARKYLEKCQSEVEKKSVDPSKYVAEMDKLRQHK